MNLLVSKPLPTDVYPNTPQADKTSKSGEISKYVNLHTNLLIK
ncbi:MAG TPA: hypothetical protein VK250_00650 [Nitrososphaeraceae archaeon]|nr:hypothetical protein [Nitrososphaeraceae archaeon]